MLFWPPFYLSHILVIILVGFGATLVTKTPGRLTGYSASLGFAISVSALYSIFYETVVFTFYPALTAMIFFGILHYRTDSKPKPLVRIPSTRQVQRPTPPEIIASDEPAPTFKPTQQVRPVVAPVEAPIASQEQDDERMARNWYNRAVTFREEGVIEEAIRSVETALKWVPDHKEALALWKELQDEKKSRQFENTN